MDKNRKPLSIRLSGLERQALDLIADQEGRNQSEMLRELIREGAIRRGLIPLCFASELMSFKNEVELDKT